MHHALFSHPRFSSMFALVVAACGMLMAATARAAPDDSITVVYVNGIATTASQATADRNALSATLQSALLRASYPQTLSVENEYNPTQGAEEDTAELVALKINEERYLARLWSAMLAGNDAPAVLNPTDPAALQRKGGQPRLPSCRLIELPKLPQHQPERPGHHAGPHQGAFPSPPLYVLFGRSASPTATQGAQRLSARPARQSGAFCGQGFGSARFVNDKGGAIFNFRSSRPVTEGVKRLNLSTSGASSFCVESLALEPIAFTAPFAQTGRPARAARQAGARLPREAAP